MLSKLQVHPVHHDPKSVREDRKRLVEVHLSLLFDIFPRYHPPSDSFVKINDIGT